MSLNARTKYDKLTIALIPDVEVAFVFDGSNNGGIAHVNSLSHLVGTELNKMAVGDVVSQTFSNTKDADRLHSAVNTWNSKTKRMGETSNWKNRRIRLDNGQVKLAVKRMS